MQPCPVVEPGHPVGFDRAVVSFFKFSLSARHHPLPGHRVLGPGELVHRVDAVIVATGHHPHRQRRHRVVTKGQHVPIAVAEELWLID